MTPGKRALDLILALVLGIVLGPVIAGLALWLRLSQGAPVFHAAERMTTPERGFTLDRKSVV